MIKATTLRLPLNQLKALKIISALENQSMNKIIQRLVKEYLEDYCDLQDARKALMEDGEISWKIIKNKLKNL